MSSTDLRPFRVEIPQEELDDLERRILATRWPTKETVADASQGVQLATMRALADYWATKHDWPTVTGWDPIRIASAWAELMPRLGYTRYVAQGGDWGNAVTEQLALQKPAGLVGIHTNMPAAEPDAISAIVPGGPEPAGLSPDEKQAWDQLVYFWSHGLGYAQEMAGRPQTLYALDDSPIGLASWMLDHDPASQAMIARVFAGGTEGLSMDDVLDARVVRDAAVTLR